MKLFMGALSKYMKNLIIKNVFGKEINKNKILPERRKNKLFFLVNTKIIQQTLTIWIVTKNGYLDP